MKLVIFNTSNEARSYIDEANNLHGLGEKSKPFSQILKKGSLFACHYSPRIEKPYTISSPNEWAEISE